MWISGLLRGRLCFRTKWCHVRRNFGWLVDNLQYFQHSQFPYFVNSVLHFTKKIYSAAKSSPRWVDERHWPQWPGFQPMTTWCATKTRSTTLNFVFLSNTWTFSGWWFHAPWKIWKSDWIIIPTIGENKTCSKPPTSFFLDDSPSSHLGACALASAPKSKLFCNVKSLTWGAAMTIVSGCNLGDTSYRMVMYKYINTYKHIVYIIYLLVYLFI